MRLIHDADGTRRELATTVETADGLLEQARGLTFRRSVPDGYAMVFPFGSVGRRGIHSLFVFVPIDVVWLVDEEVRRVKTLRPFRGLGYARADTVVELPAGGAGGVTPGDRVLLVD